MENMKKVFFSHKILDTLISEGRVSIDDTVLTLHAATKQVYLLEPAFRFLKTADGDPDPNALVGKIRFERDLKAMHAEIYLESIICRDIAYEVESGFIGTPQSVEEPLSDTELLTKGLLDGLL